jgi:hypothetical protein
MKKIIFWLTTLTVLLLACNCYNLSRPFVPTTDTPVSASRVPSDAGATTIPTAPPGTIPPDEPVFSMPWDDRSPFQRRLRPSYHGILESLPGASIYHLVLNISDPPTSISGMEEVRYTNQESTNLNEVDLAIFPEILGGSIRVDTVLLDGQKVEPIFSSGLMRVPLSEGLAPGKSVVLHVDFNVTVPSQGGDFYYGIYGYNDGILSLAHAYPTILVYNEEGWNNKRPDLDGDPLFSDTSFYLVSIDAPANLVLAASGVEISRTKDSDRQKVLYADGPARDFYLAASTEFVKYTETAGEITYNSFAPSELSKYAKSAIKTANAAIGIFSDRYAAYPYTEFNIVPIATSAGGVEFPGMTAVGKDIYNEGGFLEVVVTHEVGHQWFYNLVGNETQQQPWLDESLAEFVTCQYYQDRYGSQAGNSCEDEMKATWDIVDGEKIPIGKAVSAYSSDEYVGIVYGRGPFFFMALRDEIGQATFDRLMQDYTTTYSWNIATTDDFKRMAEQHCNCDLTSLFNEWVTP